MKRNSSCSSHQERRCLKRRLISRVAIMFLISTSHAFPPPSTAAAEGICRIKYKPLGVRGGSTTSSLASSTSFLQTTSTINGAPVATTKQDVSTKQRYWRIAKELGRHVWPSTVTDTQQERKAAISIRYRVLASVLLMLAGKVVTISTPFIFKMLIDIASSSGGTSPVAASSLMSNIPISQSIILLISYGICRSLSSIFREATNAIFAHVSQSAIRRFGRSTFDHVHSLDLSYHLNRNTGALARVLERGSRSISLVLNAMVRIHKYVSILGLTYHIANDCTLLLTSYLVLHSRFSILCQH